MRHQDHLEHPFADLVASSPLHSGLTADMSYPGGSSMLISSTLPQTVGTKVKERSLKEPALFLSVQQPRPGFNSKGEPPPKKTHSAMHLAVIIWKILGNRMKHKFLNLELGDSMHEKSNLRNPNLCWSFGGPPRPTPLGIHWLPHWESCCIHIHPARASAL